MIKIRRASCPRVLRNPRGRRSYRNESVVRTLWKMQGEKCCYCEQKIPEHGHLKAVEHFQPQDVYQDRANDWDNLLLACSQCNGSKSNLFPICLTGNKYEPKIIYLNAKAIGILINPSDPETDPEDFISFNADPEHALVGFPFGLDENGRGEKTIEITGIDDDFFIKERRDRVFDVYNNSYVQMLRYKLDDKQEALEIEKRAYAEHMSAKGKFASLARVFAREKNMDEKFGLKIPKGN